MAENTYEEEMRRIQELIAPIAELDQNELMPAMLGVVIPAVSHGLCSLPDQQRKLVLAKSLEFVESREIGGHPVTRRFGGVGKKLIALLGRVSSRPPGIDPDDVKPVP